MLMISLAICFFLKIISTDSSHITTPLQPNNILTECSFETNLCSLHSDTGDFQWIRKSGVSSAGPKAGNTNGADPYLIATASGHHGVASVTTPSFNKGSVCIDFSLYQTGPTSYLNIVLFGPHFARQTVQSYQNNYHNKWNGMRLSLSMPTNEAFQLVFEAHISAGDVAIDDLHIYPGKCV